ncbi:hypothetical protein D3C80_1132480 [compost metagenome]
MIENGDACIFHQTTQKPHIFRSLNGDALLLAFLVAGKGITPVRQPVDAFESLVEHRGHP